MKNLLQRTVSSALALLVVEPAFAVSFGTEGSHGANGRNGRSGANGSSVSIVAEGQSQSVNTAGKAGFRGDDGYYGNDAYNCHHPMDANNYQGVNGGNGGHGGIGGNGGNAGDIAVYFENRSFLKQIYVDGAPGAGGSGGRGAWAGDGCRCQSPQWRVGDYVYYCQDGRRGESGFQGQSGEDGDYGRLMLIPSKQPLPEEVSVRTLGLEQLASSEVYLNKHLWESSTGARGLFAVGSKISDQFFNFLETKEWTVTTEWNAERAMQDFLQAQVQLSANQNGIGWESLGEAWLEGKVDLQNSQHPKIQIQKAVWQKEVEDMVWDGFSGNYQNFNVQLLDRKHLENEIESRFYVKFYKKSLLWYALEWEGWMTAEQIEQKSNLYQLNIGKLPIDKSHLKPGKNVLIEVLAVRSSGTHDLKLRWEREIKIPR